MRTPSRILVLSLIAGIVCAGTSGLAATRTWDGGTDTDWGTADNWDAAFADDDDVAFYAVGAGNLNTSLGANRSVTSVTFNSDADSDVSINNNMLTIKGGGVTVDSGSAGTHAINSDVVLDVDQAWDNASSNTLSVAGQVSGSGDLAKAGSGGLYVAASNTMSGDTYINAGELEMGHIYALGGTDTGGYIGYGTTIYIGDTNGSSDATLAFGDFSPAGSRYGGPIVVRSGSSGVKTWTMPDPSNSYGPMRPQITLNGNLVVRIGDSGDDRWAMSATTSVSGSGDLIYEEPGYLELNTAGLASGHTGDWIIRGGDLKINIGPPLGDPVTTQIYLGATNGSAQARVWIHNNGTYVYRDVIVRSGSSGKKAMGTYWYSARNNMGTRGRVILGDDLWLEPYTAGSQWRVRGEVSETNGAHKITVNGGAGSWVALETNGYWSGGTDVVAARLAVTNDGLLAHANVTIGGGTKTAQLDGNGRIVFRTGELIDVNANGTLDATQLEFDLVNMAAVAATIVDYADSGTFLGPATLDDLLSAESVTVGWSLTDTGSQVTASPPPGGTVVVVQ